MDFRRNKTYHDILSERREGGDEHLVTNTRMRWAAAGGGMLVYLLLIGVFYRVSDVGYLTRQDLQTDVDTVPAWKHVFGVLLNTSAVGFSVIFLVSATLWALRAASPKYFLAFGTLGLCAGVLVAFTL